MYVTRNSSIQRFVPSWNTGTRSDRAYRQVRRYPRGLGQTAQQINSIATTGAQTTVGILAALSVIPGPGWVAGAIGGLIAVASAIAGMFHGCGETCVAATQDANKAESLLKQNLDVYRNTPIHYVSIQAAALNNVQTFFAALQQACSDPQLGDAGRRCISERLVRGGTAPWCPNPGHTGCDWYALYYDPIANDPNVVPDPSPVSQIGSDISSGTTSLLQTLGVNPAAFSGLSFSDFLLPVGLILAGLLLPSSSGKR